MQLEAPFSFARSIANFMVPWAWSRMVSDFSCAFFLFSVLRSLLILLASSVYFFIPLSTALQWAAPVVLLHCMSLHTPPWPVLVGCSCWAHPPPPHSRRKWVDLSLTLTCFAATMHKWSNLAHLLAGSGFGHTLEAHLVVRLARYSQQVFFQRHPNVPRYPTWTERSAISC